MRYFLKLVSLVYFFLLFYITFLAERRNNGQDFRKLAIFDVTHKLKVLIHFDELSTNLRYSFLENFIGNIVLFIPFITALVLLFGFRFDFRKALAFVFLSSLCIETMQYITNKGIFDVSDIFLNTFGGLLGFFVWSILCKYLPKHLEV